MWKTQNIVLIVNLDLVMENVINLKALDKMTAEELIKNKLYTTQDGEPIDVHDSISSVEEAMIEFAKYHVQEALKAASEEVKLKNVKVKHELIGDVYIKEIDKNSILKSYPLKNIK